METTFSSTISRTVQIKSVVNVGKFHQKSGTGNGSPPLRDNVPFFCVFFVAPIIVTVSISVSLNDNYNFQTPLRQPVHCGGSSPGEISQCVHASQYNTGEQQWNVLLRPISN